MGDYLSQLKSFFRPSRTVPKVPWTAPTPWTLNIPRLAILFSGLFIFGIGDALLIVSNLGNSPWTVLAQGVSKQLGISVGISTLIVSLAVLTMWIPLKEKPGFGTIANVFVIASAIDLGIHFLPKQEILAFELFYAFVGIVLVGLGSALYITCGLGSGPRDGWMTAIHRKTEIPVGRVRFGIEVLVLVTGWALGGVIGLGTALFATFIGPSVAISFGVVTRVTSR